VQEISQITRALKALAKELDVPVIALSQLSRAVEQRAAATSARSSRDLRESGSVEQDADVVLFVFREEYYKPDDPALQGQGHDHHRQAAQRPDRRRHAHLPARVHEVRALQRDDGGRDESRTSSRWRRFPRARRQLHQGARLDWVAEIGRVMIMLGDVARCSFRGWAGCAS
jgi:hypothetical protein